MITVSTNVPVCGSWTLGHSYQVSQKKTAKWEAIKGWPEQDRKNRTAKTGQSQQDSSNKAERQDSQDRIPRGERGQNSKYRTARK
jgi:hypothetical protein